MQIAASNADEGRQPTSARYLRLARELGFWLLGKRLRFRASGTSMEPTFSAGDHLLVERLSTATRRLCVGEVVVARHPQVARTLVIKRVGRCGPGSVWLASDNARCGTDSRQFGPVMISDVVGRVTASIGREGRARVH